MTSVRPRILITGASGYIGQRLVELATERGCEVIALGRTSVGNAACNVAWRLGEEPPQAAFEGTTAVIHLAHSWAGDLEGGELSDSANVLGSEKLARAAIAAGVPRFVLASSVSARPDALNAYGRTKYALEQRLEALPNTATRVISARIGLVYGGREAAQYGLLSRLVRLTPILPMIGVDRKVQPIYIDEVCLGLLTIALDASPVLFDDSHSTFVLAAPVPMTFGDLLRLLRRAHTGKGMLLIPFPVSVALAICKLTRIIPFLPTINCERILGLAGTTPMESAQDLSTLEITVQDPVKWLASLRSERRRIVAEAIAILSYVTRSRVLTKAAIARLVRGIDRLDGRSLGLPWLVLKCPALLRGLDPIRPHYAHRLAQRLHLAAMVMESAQDQDRAPAPSPFSLFRQLLLDVIALPFRLVLGSLYS